MCRKLLLLIAVLGLISTAWADDINPPPWRSDPGSAMFQWTYDEPPPSVLEFPRSDAPEVSSYVLHPDKTDPGNLWDRAIEEAWIYEDPMNPGTYLPGEPGVAPEEYLANAMQIWGDYEWIDTYKGRTGVLSPFNAGSWDIYNFDSDPPQPYKDIWIQLTWAPYLITEGWYETTEALWNPFDWGDPEETWDEEGTMMAGGTLNLGENYTDMGGNPVYVGDPYDAEVVGFTWEVEGFYSPDGEGYWWLEELAPFEVVDLMDGWEVWKWDIRVWPNPNLEFLGLFPVGTPIGDPYEMGGSEFEGLLADYPPDWPQPPQYTWIDEETGEEWAYHWLEAPLTDWDPLWGDPMETWTEQDRGPAPIAVDQIVIDTICYTPEPSTIALLGLGGLALIRRRKR